MQVHSVLESLQQGILICDQHSRIVFFNQVYGDFIGVPLETAKGHKITEYRNLPSLRRSLRAAFRSREWCGEKGRRNILQVFIQSGRRTISAGASRS